MTASTRPRLNLEPLDRRDVPAAVTLNSGVLAIEGTNVGESVSVSTMVSGNTRLRVTTPPQGGSLGTMFEFQYAPGVVQTVVFNGYGGSDVFTNGTAIPSVADGGYGNDTLIGGSGNDLLVGTTDSIVASFDNDEIHGGGGNDTLQGGSGADTLFGEGGSDTLQGGTGNDRLYGREGSDRLYGDLGHDTLVGGVGTDRLWGGEGRDTLWGDNYLAPFGDGVIDYLYGQGGADEFHYPCEDGGPAVTDFDAGEDDTEEFYCPPPE